MIKRNRLLQAALIGAAVLSAPAFAQEGNWMVRGRAVHLNMANNSDPVPSLLVPSDAITVKDKWIPELDVTYFFTPNIAAELVLTIPQKGKVTVQQSALGGPTPVGSFKYLPPTLMLQYHFIPNGAIRPYAGVGINYTHIFSTDLNVPVVDIPLELSRNSFGLAAGAGVDFQIDKNWFLNLDVKYAQISADVKIKGGPKISKVKVDPWLLGVGVGYRF
jgi:outer membrane protein